MTKELLPALLLLNPSPRIVPKLAALPVGKQRDMVPLVQKYGFSVAYQMVTNGREPGEEPKLPKVGSVKFNWKLHEGSYGKIVRAVDEAAKVFDDQGHEHSQCLFHLGKFLEVWSGWRKKLTRSEV